jgi:hypothetical protein
MRVHHSYGLRHWLPAMLLTLWREWHEGEPVQLQLSLESNAENVAAPTRKAKMPKVSVPSTTESATPLTAIHGNNNGRRVSSTSVAATAACHLRIEAFLELVLMPNPQGIGQPGTVHDARLGFTRNLDNAAQGHSAESRENRSAINSPKHDACVQARTSAVGSTSTTGIAEKSSVDGSIIDEA